MEGRMHMEREHILENNDQIFLDKQNMLLAFSGMREVLSTSCLNGGFTDHCTHVFNHCDKDPATGMCMMRGATYEEHLEYAAEGMELDPKHCTGLSTAAPVERMVTASRSFSSYTMTAIVTAGLDVNGRRAGDPATMWEEGGIYHSTDEQAVHTSGTVNIFVHITAHLARSAMATALMVAAEAKTASIRELQLASCYSSELCSGSGTDGIVIITDPGSPVTLTAAGTDTKLGECIAAAVTEAVKKELRLYMAERIGAGWEQNMQYQLRRFAIDPKLSGSECFAPGCLPEDACVGLTLYMHLMDQVRWKLITEEAAWKTAITLLNGISTLPEAEAEQIRNGKNDDHLLALLIYWIKQYKTKQE